MLQIWGMWEGSPLLRNWELQQKLHCACSLTYWQLISSNCICSCICICTCICIYIFLYLYLYLILLWFAGTTNRFPHSRRLQRKSSSYAHSESDMSAIPWSNATFLKRQIVFPDILWYYVNISYFISLLKILYIIQIVHGMTSVLQINPNSSISLFSLSDGYLGKFCLFVCCKLFWRKPKGRECVSVRGNGIANALNAKCVVKHSINHLIGHVRHTPTYTPNTKHQSKFKIKTHRKEH